MGKVYKLSESVLSNIVEEAVGEMFSRDSNLFNAMSSLGIKDPSDKYSVDEEELQQKCKEFVQSCNEFKKIVMSFYQYLNGVEEDEENGVKGTDGVLMTMKYRNMFGARNLGDEYLQESLQDLTDTVHTLDKTLEDVVYLSENM